MREAERIAPTGVLRASINLGNPVLAQGTPAAPGGVTVDLARDLAARLDLPLELLCFDAARDSFAAVRDGLADIGFLAIDPARATDVAFTPPYVVIEGVYAVPADSPIHGLDAVDHPGNRIGVKEGSAYDLHLSRALRDAEVVRGTEGTSVAQEAGLELAAGIRQPVADWAKGCGWRVLEPAFMQIRQAVAVPADRSSAVADLTRWMEERKADGFVAAALRASGRTDGIPAAPAG